MFKTFLAAVLTCALLAAAAWALAQQAVPAPRDDAPRPAARQQPPSADLAPPVPQPRETAPARAGSRPARYAVALSGERGLLVDTDTGGTWDLQRDARGRAVWVPARRLDAEKDYREWIERESKLHREEVLKDREKARQKAADAARVRLDRERLDAATEREAVRQALRDAELRLKTLQDQQHRARAEQQGLLDELTDRELRLQQLQDRLDAAQGKAKAKEAPK
jgi:hypothetical protein